MELNRHKLNISCEDRIIYLYLPSETLLNALYMYINKKLTNNKHNKIKMNKVWKAIAIVGNLSEVIIATTIVADLFNKIRGSRKATSTTIEVEDNPQPEQPMAA